MRGAQRFFGRRRGLPAAEEKTEIAGPFRKRDEPLTGTQGDGRLDDALYPPRRLESVHPLEETGSIIASPLVLKDQIVYVTEDGYINFIDRAGADVIAPVKIENAKLYTTPILAGDLILVAPMNAEFVLAAYNQKGIQQWKFIPAK